MRQPEPDWYAELRSEPLRVRTFTPELADRIRAEAVRSAKAKAASPHRTWYYGALAGCLAAVLLLVVQLYNLTPDSLYIGSRTGGQGDSISAAGGGDDAAAGPAAPAEAPGIGSIARNAEDDGANANPPDLAESAAPSGMFEFIETAGKPDAALESAGSTDSADSGDSGDYAGDVLADSPIRYAVWAQTPMLTVKEPTPEEWQLLIDATDPDRNYQFLAESLVDDRWRLIMSRNLTASGDALRGKLKMYLMHWSMGGWMWDSAVGLEPDNLRAAEDRVITGWMEFGPDEQKIKIFMGFLLDPDIVGVRVKDEQGDVYEAKLFPEPEGVTIWYAYTRDPGGKGYTVEGLDAEGNAVYRKPLVSRALGPKAGPDADADERP